MRIVPNQNGATLMEMLVVIAIIGIMISVIAPRYSKYKNAKSLGMTKTQITNDIRVVQNYTFTTMKFGSDFPTGGYGIHFASSSGSYIIFADVDSDGKYDNPGERVEEILLPQGIRITTLKDLDGGGNSNKVDFVCTPPYGSISIKHNGGSWDGVSVTYANDSGDSVLSISNTGQID